MNRRGASITAFNIVMVLFLITSLLRAKMQTSPREITGMPFYVNDVVKTVHDQQNRDGEFLIDTAVVYGPTSGEQGSQAIAFDGTNYLVVWHDSRNGLRDIYGTRVDQSGNVLDPNGIAISTAVSAEEDPAVAFNGECYLVVWEDRNGFDIRGARVDQSGNVLDSLGVAISTASNYQYRPTVCSDGVDFLVAWTDTRTGEEDIYGARVHHSGVVIDTVGIEICTTNSYQIAPAVSFCDGIFLVVWYDGRNTSHDIYGARVTQSGIVLDPAGIAISAESYDQQHPTVATDGHYHFVVWHDYRNTTLPDIYGARVSNDGAVVDPSGIVISYASEEQMRPNITYDGTNYLVAWLDGRFGLQGYVYGARVTQSGTVLDPTGIAISNHGFIPAVSSDSTNCLVCWGYEGDIYGARINQAGTVLDPDGILITIGTNFQWQPEVAFDGVNYLVIWQDLRSDYGIYGIRVDQLGNVLDSSAIEISAAPDMQRNVSVTFGGSDYLVVWEDERNYPEIQIRGARVTQSGIVLDPSGILIADVDTDENRPHPAVAFDGNNYLVVWEEIQWYPYLDILGRFLNQSGNFVGYVFDVSSAQDYQFRPSIAFDGNNYLVVWHDYRSGVGDIYGARVTPAGTVLDPQGIAISTAADHQSRPALAFDGTNYLVVWVDWRNGGSSNDDIYGARVTPSGTVLDPAGIPISTAPNGQGSPSVTYGDASYLVVWNDFRDAAEFDIYGAEVSTSGIVVDSFPVSLQSGDQFSPTVAHGLGQQILVAYSGWTGIINSTSYNAMRIWGKLYPFVGVEEGEGGVFKHPRLTATIIQGPLQLPKGRKCKVFDITGRVVEPTNISCGIYFVEIDNKVVQKVVKIR